MFGPNNFLSPPPLETFIPSLNKSASTFDVHDQFKGVPANKTTKRRKWKKPKGKPKRPLSAYNLFFQKERENLVKDKTKIGFADLAKNIAAKWKKLEESDKVGFNAKAEKEQKRYKAELVVWEKEQERQRQEQQVQSTPNNNSLLNLQQQSNMLQNYLFQQQVMMQMRAISSQVSAARSMSMPLGNLCQQQMDQMEASRRLSMPGISEIQQPKLSTPSKFATQQEARNSLDIETSNFLLNMPIMDMGGNNNSISQGLPKQEQKSLEEQIADFDLTSGGTMGLPSSMLQRESSLGMNEILNMLDEDDTISRS
eukprot:CAMPEP_0202445112 /NCGR_PEP_ID=MMETSP1360-20130828/3994_1 /ASSEMBLY_ACC=CAM_ASM_000848 /TAXON_ID=515479 /ORGANISM="Licmophora paradoxa, Strain CCMP2313" /LENGTH=310 /DNA_ID=CAMNT_0049061271 /DNA_START=61 /DNA_END=996 /DNA_ORIENTATION=-